MRMSKLRRVTLSETEHFLNIIFTRMERLEAKAAWESISIVPGLYIRHLVTIVTISGHSSCCYESRMYSNGESLGSNRMPRVGVAMSEPAPRPESNWKIRSN